MGSCFSSSLFSESELSPPAAKVVSINGDLREYSLPVCVSQVLQAEAAIASSSSSSSSSTWFLCNSDLLCYDDYIPALNSHHQLQHNQLYFVLPQSKLQNRLAATDMAALAVKASVALQKASKNSVNRRKRTRISPVVLVNQPPSWDPQNDSQDVNAMKSFEKGKQQAEGPMGFSRSSSVRRLHRFTSRRAKLAARSFKLRLSTIYESTVL